MNIKAVVCGEGLSEPLTADVGNDGIATEIDCNEVISIYEGIFG